MPDECNSAPFQGSLDGDGPFMLEKATAEQLIGLLAALNNVTFSPDGAGEFIWSPSNLVVKIKIPNKDAQLTTAVFLELDDDGSVTAKQGDFAISNIQDYSP